MKKYIIHSSLTIVLLMACANEAISPDKGSLDIKVTIAPLCPIEPCNKTAAELKLLYESYSFVVSNLKDKSIVLEQKLTHNGTNGLMKNSNIVVGEYELNIKPENFFTKRGFPKLIKIEKDKTTSLEIDIDTGLR